MIHVRIGRIATPLALVAATVLSAGRADAQAPRQADTQQREGEALLALADAALGGRPVPDDLRIGWHNDFLKAQQGTFVPFTVTIEASPAPAVSALLYVRAVPRRLRTGEESSRGRTPAVDAIIPVQTVADGRGRARVTRGFSVPAGDYDICVIVRERIDPRDPGATPRAGVAVLPVSVPDLWTGRLSASTVLLARRLEVLEAAPSADDLSSRPYVIGRNELTPAADGRFGTGEELVVVLLVYDATIADGGRFDVEVEYHFFRRAAGGDAMAVTPPGAPRPEPGERYFNHTEPQRFTPASMGRTFDPTQPVLAGQGIPLAGFAPGEYRLAVQVADRLSGHRVSRDVVFTVVPRR